MRCFYMIVGNSVIIRTLGLPPIYDFSHLAMQLSISKKTLYMMINKKEYFYSKKEILKRDGTIRTLRVPAMPLKVVQKWILEEILKKLKVSKYSMAFVPGKNGLKESAELHNRNLFLLEMDISDFFGSISQKKVFKLFLGMGYGLDVSAILAELCTYDDSLPQGAVTSPCLANLICFNLDARLNGLCRKKDIIFSRYADDLCFSSNNRTLLNKIEPIVIKILKDEGFEANQKKTRYLSDDVKKTVVGITINNKGIHVDKKLKKNVRSQIFNAIKNNDYTQKEKIIGTIAYISSIESGYKEKIVSYINEITRKDFLRENSTVVCGYNNNKFFKESLDMEILQKE